MTATLLPFVAFAFVASGTPGPNNIMVLATAAAHGLRATVPLILGVALGFGFMVAVVGTGLAGPLASHPTVHTVLRWVGAAWLLVLAWRIARAGGPAVAGPSTPRPPIGFWAAWVVQWVNPKAWVMALATTATYTVPGDDLTRQVLVLAALFAVISLPCVGAWALLGAGSGRFMTSPARLRAFNTGMGLLLAASVVPAILE